MFLNCRKMSSLWRYFEKHENVAFCKHCDFKKNLTSTAPTTALFDHLKIKHPELNDEMLERNKLYLQEKVKEEWETGYMNAEEEGEKDGAIGMRVNAGNIPFGNARYCIFFNLIDLFSPFFTNFCLFRTFSTYFGTSLQNPIPVNKNMK